MRAGWLLSVVAGLCATFAVAGSVAVESDSLAAGNAVVAGCDGDGLVVGYSQDPGGRLISFHVNGIHASCAGGTVRVTLMAGASIAAMESADLPADGFASGITLALSAQPNATTITRADVVIEGR